MYDLPWWVMGFLCLLALALPVVLIVVVLVAANRPRRRRPEYFRQDE